MSDLTYPDIRTGKLSVEPRYSTERVLMETGYEVRNALWNHAALRFSMDYEILTAVEFDELLNFFLRHRGGFEAFRFDDYADLAPTTRDFGVGTGVERQFKLPHDYTEGVAIYVDEQANSGVYVNPSNGRVLFAAAPVAGARLTFSAISAGYRVRFADDSLPYDRHRFVMYGGRVSLEQVLDQSDLYPIRQEVQGGTSTTATLDATGDAVAFSFVAPVAVTVSNLSYYAATVTSPGTTRVSICANTSGAPGTVLASGNHTPAGVGWQTVSMGTPYALTQGTRYWVVVEALSGTWGASNLLGVRYAASCPDMVTADPQDALLYGAYVVADQDCDNTQNSWLGVSTRSGAGAWSTRDPSSHGVFWLNTSGTIVGHAQDALSQEIAADVRTRLQFVNDATHDFTIDRIAAVISTVEAPADDLDYLITTTDGAATPTTDTRTGTLCTAVDTGAGKVWAERFLSSPLTIPAGDTVTIDLYSPLAVAVAGWTHYGFYVAATSDYATGWNAAWNDACYSGDDGLAYISADGGATWATELRGGWAIRCRGWFEA